MPAFKRLIKWSDSVVQEGVASLSLPRSQSQ